MPGLDRFGRALVARTRRLERRRSRARRFGVALSIALPIAATSGAATAVVLREAVIAPPDPAHVPDEGAGFLEDPRGRIERRVESTRVVFSGLVHPDVETVTIRTPRDVRTLVPSSKAHAILAVYGDRFPGGKVTATARMKDGREVTRTLYVE